MPFTSLVYQLPFSIRTQEKQLMNKDDRLHMRCWLLVGSPAPELVSSPTSKTTNTKSTCNYGSNHPNLMPVMSSLDMLPLLLLLEG